MTEPGLVWPAHPSGTTCLSDDSCVCLWLLCQLGLRSEAAVAQALARWCRHWRACAAPDRCLGRSAYACSAGDRGAAARHRPQQHRARGASCRSVVVRGILDSYRRDAGLPQPHSGGADESGSQRQAPSAEHSGAAGGGGGDDAPCPVECVTELKSSASLRFSHACKFSASVLPNTGASIEALVSSGCEQPLACMIACVKYPVCSKRLSCVTVPGSQPVTPARCVRSSRAVARHPEHHARPDADVRPGLVQLVTRSAL